MNDATRRERRSPDLRTIRQHYQDRQVVSEVTRKGWYSRGYLPHFESSAVTQHVTVHLADSLPDSAIKNIELSLNHLPESKKKIERRKKLENWIDAGHGSCPLQIPTLAHMVEEELLYFHDERYSLHAWVVMPNHFHALVQPINNWTLAKIVATWKKYTARRIKEYLRDADQVICVPGGWHGIETRGIIRRTDREDCIRRNWQRSVPVWHHEFWDRYIRDEEHYWDTVEYIHNNPVKARLVKYPEEWKWSSASIDRSEYGC